MACRRKDVPWFSCGPSQLIVKEKPAGAVGRPPVPRETGKPDSPKSRRRFCPFHRRQIHRQQADGRWPAEDQVGSVANQR